LLKISSGNVGGLKLDGTAFALMASWPGPIHFGRGTAKLLIDAKASEKKRELLEKIVKGELGGKPWPLFARTFDKWLKTSHVPFEWKSDGAHSEVVAGDILRVALQPIRNPVTGKEARVRILLPDGLITKEENVTATKTFSLFADELKYAWPGRTAFYATVQHNN